MASSLSVNSKSSSTKSHHCNKCSYSATSKSSLNRHYVIHSTDRPFGCHHCQYRAKCKGSVKTHEKTHHSVVPTRHKGKRHNPCTFPGCTYRSNRSHWARAHERTVHGFNRFEKVKSNNGRWKPTTFTGTMMESRRSQLGIPTGEIVQGSSSPLPIKLEEPSRKKLEGQGPTEKTNEKLVQSALELAAGAKSWERIGCPECGFKCLPGSLQRHVMVHSDEKPYACAVKGCEYRTRWPGDLKVHMKRHEAERQRISEVKSSQVQVTKSRTTETRTSSSTEEVQTEAEAPIEITPSLLSLNTGSSSTKPYHCTKCSYSGASKHHLNSHYAIHSTDRPFGCHYCPYRSKWKGSVPLHEKRHHSGKPRRLNGLRPFPCTFPGCSYRSKTAGGAHIHESKVHKFTRSHSSQQINWKAQQKSTDQVSNKLKPSKAQVGKAVQISPTTKIPTQSSTEKVQCPQCDLKIYCNFLQNHLKVHCGGGKLFGCSVKRCKYRTKWLKDHKTRCGKQQEVAMELQVVNDDNEMEQENYIEISMEPTGELVDSTGFACTLCDFVGYSEVAALNHAKCHTQPFFPVGISFSSAVDKLNEIPTICLD